MKSTARKRCWYGGMFEGVSRPPDWPVNFWVTPLSSNDTLLLHLQLMNFFSTFFFLILSDISPQLSLFGRKYEGTALPWTVQSSTECIQWPHNVTACSAEVAILNLCEYIPEIHRRTRSTFLYYIFSVKGGDGGLSIAKWTVFETNVAGDWTAGLVFAKHSTLELYPHPKSVTSFIN